MIRLEIMKSWMRTSEISYFFGVNLTQNSNVIPVVVLAVKRAVHAHGCAYISS
jgi:hypothetical protein